MQLLLFLKSYFVILFKILSFGMGFGLPTSSCHKFSPRPSNQNQIKLYSSAGYGLQGFIHINDMKNLITQEKTRWQEALAEQRAIQNCPQRLRSGSNHLTRGVGGEEFGVIGVVLRENLFISGVYL